MKRSVMINKLIVGLGNHSIPTTRHSIGMAVLNNLAENLGVSWNYERKCSGFIAKYIRENENIILLKPRIPMNVNGRSILKAVTMYSVELENLFLVHDDLDKPLGKVRFKAEGSASGHNGVRSAIATLRDDRFKRFKVGIGRPSNKNEITDYVLSDFTHEELPLVEETLSKCIALILQRLKTGVRPKQFQILTDIDYEKYERIDEIQRSSGRRKFLRRHEERAMKSA